MTDLRISPSNNKLGKIASFSLPSITSCPGATNECVSSCYAINIENYPGAKNAYALNLQAIKDKNFVFSLSEEITRLTTKKTPIKTFRWHVSGDIINLQYLMKMEQIMKKFSTLTFYAYTRTWSLENWAPHLDKIKKSCPNFTMIASLDDDHVDNDTLPGPEWRVAYFGSKTKDELATLTGKQTIVCPNQANTTKTILCDTCQYCFNPKLANTTKSVYFIKH